MRKVFMSLIVSCLLAMLPAMAAETPPAADAHPAKHATAKKESPSMMQKTRAKAKAGWHKLTASVKQGSKKPSCTEEQHSLKQC